MHAPHAPPMQRTAGSRRVLLLDEGFMSGAHTAIGLRSAGCDVSIIAAVGGRGRCIRPSLQWMLAPQAGSRAFDLMIERLPVLERYDHVLALTEPLQAWLWDRSPCWIERVFPRTTEWQQRLFRDKRFLSEHLQARGIPIPCQHSLDATDVDTIPASLRFPVVIKGIRGRGGNATRIVGSRAEALAAVGALSRAAGGAFVQEYVPGPTYLVGGVFDRGTPLRLYAAEKLEVHPPRTGPSTLLRSVSNERLLRTALRAFAELNITGIASADFIRTLDGEYLFLELNPRPWGSIAAAADAGVDLFTPLVELLEGGNPAPRLDYRENVVSLVFPLYLLARAHWRWLGAIREIVRDLRSPQGTMWRDPGQATHLVHRLIRVGLNWKRH